MRESYELDTGIGNAYLFFLIEPAHSHFEGFFAHTEKAVDIFGRGPVVIGEEAFVLFEEAKDPVGGVFGTLVARLTGHHVDLRLAGRRSFSGRDLFDEAAKAVADGHIAKRLVEVEHAGMPVVDNDEPAYMGTS